MARPAPAMIPALLRVCESMGGGRVVPGRLGVFVAFPGGVFPAVAAANTKFCAGPLAEKLRANESWAAARAGWPSQTSAAHVSAVRQGGQAMGRIFMGGGDFPGEGWVCASALWGFRCFAWHWET